MAEAQRQYETFEASELFCRLSAIPTGTQAPASGAADGEQVRLPLRGMRHLGRLKNGF